MHRLLSEHLTSEYRVKTEVRGRTVDVWELRLRVVTEAKDPETLGAVAEVAEVLQIGTRNMQNFTLLEAAGRLRKPVLVAVGPPVARRPPHRSRRAELPHRALASDQTHSRSAG